MTKLSIRSVIPKNALKFSSDILEQFSYVLYNEYSPFGSICIYYFVAKLSQFGSPGLIDTIPTKTIRTTYFGVNFLFV